MSDYPSLNKQLEHDGKERQKIEADGNCLFRAISHQLHGTQKYYNFYRIEACKCIEENPKEFAPFFREEEPMRDYLFRMRMDGTWGDNYALTSLSMRFKLKIIIYESYRKKLIICYNTPNPEKTIYLAYVNHRHYNSVVDKGKASEHAGCYG